jgi:hypothetical protein
VADHLTPCVSPSHPFFNKPVDAALLPFNLDSAAAKRDSVLKCSKRLPYQYTAVFDCLQYRRHFRTSTCQYAYRTRCICECRVCFCLGTWFQNHPRNYLQEEIIVCQCKAVQYTRTLHKFIDICLHAFLFQNVIPVAPRPSLHTPN